jgi:peptide deformylase
MMKVLRAPDPKLRIQTKPVKKITPALLDKLKEMVKMTKSFIDPEGVGLASTQVGEDEQYFVLKQDNEEFISIFNPKILEFSPKTKVYLEGCLSIPDYYGEVIRSLWVKVQYMDEKGNKVEKKLNGTEAWIFQHECDHLQGKLFIDHVLTQKGKMFKVVGRDRAGAEIFEEVKL